MAYEKKFRKRVLEYMDEGHTQQKTAETFGISTATIKRWRNSLATTGSLEIKIRNRNPKKLFPEELNAYVIAHPDAYLSEIAEHFNCTAEAVRLALKKLKITRKKRR